MNAIVFQSPATAAGDLTTGIWEQPIGRRSPPPRGQTLDGFLLPLRLAWRLLRSGKARLAAGIAGVAFACILVFMQLGFRAAVFVSATNLQSAMRADIFLMSPMKKAIFMVDRVPRVRASQALALPEVRAAVPVYLVSADWRNPENGTHRSLEMVGFDLESGVMAFPGLTPQLIEALKSPDTLAFDQRSRAEFGDVKRLLAERGSLEAEVGGRKMEVAGLVEIGPSFAIDGNVVMSELNFKRITGHRSADADLVAIKLVPGADRDVAVARLKTIMPSDVLVLKQPEWAARERAYWDSQSPIGFVFTFGSLMGLVVGMGIVYQILFSDIASHLKEYATLKAVGYSKYYLCRTVLSAALLLAVLGFIPALGLSIVLYHVVGKSTHLPMLMEAYRAVSVFVMIFVISAVAGLLAMRKLSDANPADIF